ncbi:hypothetical protein HPB50_006754 [Hyalomma asiaticum]|uniref:Uncharacterized protein n=1 Tax=Hyalomma asiaticum TaxID=266040 RepID=A0ACB7SK70_HYAAI|nr:hypothetical protein HPB50_006754 [Hyalomma asiaticum]
MKARIENGVVHSPHPPIDIPVSSFCSLIKEKLLRNPNKTALIDDVTSMTRAEVLARMQRYTVGFRQNGVLPGDRICIHLKNSIHNLLATYGCIMAGATVVLSNTSLNESELRYQAKDSDSTHVLTDAELAEKVSGAVESLPIKGLFSMGRAKGFVSAADFEELDEIEYQECAVADPKDTVLAVCYTSGSTGMPKGVEMTHYNFVACFYSTRYILPFGEQDMFLAVNLFAHLSGLLYAVIVLLDGGTIVMPPVTLSSTEIMDVVDKYQVTAMHLFPTRLQALVREMRRTGRRLPSMKRIGITGSVLTASAADAARQAFDGLECLLNVYAMTESCSIITSQPKAPGTCTGGDVGVPNVTAKLKVVDFTTGKKLGPQEIGEIRFHVEARTRERFAQERFRAAEGWAEIGEMKRAGQEQPVQRPLPPVTESVETPTGTPMEIPTETPAPRRSAKKRALSEPILDEGLEELRAELRGFQSEWRDALKALSEAVSAINARVDSVEPKKTITDQLSGSAVRDVSPSADSSTVQASHNSAQLASPHGVLDDRIIDEPLVQLPRSVLPSGPWAHSP